MKGGGAVSAVAAARQFLDVIRFLHEVEPSGGKPPKRKSYSSIRKYGGTR